MAKGKRTNRQTTIYKILYLKLKIEQHELHKNWYGISVSQMTTDMFHLLLTVPGSIPKNCLPFRIIRVHRRFVCFVFLNLQFSVYCCFPFFWPLFCLSFDLQILITPLVSFFAQPTMFL